MKLALTMLTDLISLAPIYWRRDRRTIGMPIRHKTSKKQTIIPLNWQTQSEHEMKMIKISSPSNFYNEVEFEPSLPKASLVK